VYTHINFKTKKALKAAVEAYLNDHGPGVTIFQPGPFGGNEPKNGIVYLEGPHYPKPHRWYAKAWVEDGFVVRVQ